MNYGEVKAAILGYLQNNDVDLIDNLDAIITRTQLRLRSLRIPEKEKRIHSKGPDIALPDDVEEIKEVWVQSERNPNTDQYDEDYPEGVNHHCRPVSWQWMSSKLQIDGGSQPLYYARRRLEDGTDSLRMFPSGSTQSIEITYYFRPLVLTQDTESNVYTTNFPDLLIYGGVSEAYRWLRTEDKMIVWEQMFSALYDEIQLAGQNRDYRGGTMTMDSPSHQNVGRSGW